MTSPKKQRRLVNLLINPRFQGRVAFVVFFAGFGCAAINAYLYYSYVVGSYEFILKYSSLSQALVDERYRDLYNFALALGLATLLIIVVIAIWAVFVTHRAAGAVHHLKLVIDDIRAGNVQARVHLRQKDEFQDVAVSFNQMMDELQKGKASG
jgi:HAMP domain-containing protein